MWRFLRIFLRDSLQTWIFFWRQFVIFLILRIFFEVIRYHPLGRLMLLLRVLVTRFLRNITERNGFHSLPISVLSHYPSSRNRNIRDELLYRRLRFHHLPHPLHSQWLKGELVSPSMLLASARLTTQQTRYPYVR